MGRESGVFTTMLKLQFVSFLEAGCRLVPDRRLSEKPDVERQGFVPAFTNVALVSDGFLFNQSMRITSWA
jgi:hypothetical protein